MLAEAKDNILIPSVTSKILRLLDSLKRSEGGATIYNYIEQVIRDNAANCHQVEHAYASLLTLLLDTLAPSGFGGPQTPPGILERQRR